ncbi:MAG TPA: Gfo/Idh/MocA family oxidoreductase [Acidimicrobiia bacterium]|nr:Gfo/Idh/MocA family oxidoreductase [Acidimicrobiia bacterium]
MSEQAPVKWGVLSTARIGTEKVIPATQRSRLAVVDAIASRDLARSTEAAQSLGIPKAYGSYEEMLADDEIEAIYNPLPNNLHPEWTMAAAKAGKHVLCEKPLAMTAPEAREMVEACEKAGVLLMEAFMYRLHPLWVEAKRMADSGAIGEVRGITSVFSYFNNDPTNIRNIADAGGGALYDIGCYPVNVSRLIFGSEPTDVSASIVRDPDMGIDILTAAILEFEQGTSVLMCSTRLEPDQRVEILGTEGRLVIEIPFNIPPDIPTRLLHLAGGDPPVDPRVTVHEIDTVDPYTVQADVFSAAVRGASPLPFPPSDAIANLEVIERIFATAG